VPAFTFFWTGLVDGDFDNPGNWMSMMIEEGPPPPSLPGAGDHLVFAPFPENPFEDPEARPCGNIHPPGSGAYGSVTLTEEYDSTVTVEEEFSTHGLFLEGGTIDQPSSGTDITVIGGFFAPANESFIWTGGTLNSTSNLATLTVTGSNTTGRIEPDGGGTITLGSHFTMENGAAVTMKEGTVDVNKTGLQFITATGSSFAIDPGTLKTAILGVLQPPVPLEGLVMAGTSWTVWSGKFKHGGPIGNAGTVTLMPGVAVFLSGDPQTNEGYVQWAENAATYLHGFSNLASEEEVLISGGTLATVWSDYYSTGHATIIAPTVKVSGGHIYLDWQGANHHFGELIIDGNLVWSGGTYHPYVYSEGVANDVWRTISRNHPPGTFTINGGTIAPVYLDSDYGTSSPPTTGAAWNVLQTGSSFSIQTAPSVDNTFLWGIEIDPMQPPLYFKLVAN
jgi:hypothetical protein